MNLHLYRRTFVPRKFKIEKHGIKYHCAYYAKWRLMLLESGKQYLKCVWRKEKLHILNPRGVRKGIYLVRAANSKAPRVFRLHRTLPHWSFFINWFSNAILYRRLAFHAPWEIDTQNRPPNGLEGGLTESDPALIGKFLNPRSFFTIWCVIAPNT